MYSATSYLPRIRHVPAASYNHSGSAPGGSSILAVLACGGGRVVAATLLVSAHFVLVRLVSSGGTNLVSGGPPDAGSVVGAVGAGIDVVTGGEACW